VKNFRWEGELQQKGSGHSYTRLLRARRFIRINGIYLRRPPFLPYGIRLQYTAPTRHGDRTNEPYTPREVSDEPLIPHPTRQPGLTARYSALLYTLGIGDLGWGPRIRHLDLFLHVPLFLWGGNHAASRRTAGVYTHRAFKWEQGQDNGIHKVIWKHGTNGRQGNRQSRDQVLV
jgi:hypothetical protein